MVQLSFTLPIQHSKVAEGAAVQLANKMGMDPALVVHAKPMGEGFTFFVVYGRVNHLVDPSTVEVVERDYPLLTPKEANSAIKSALRRRLVVVGGCIGTDAHTVGIDAILNIKGFAGEKGLEYYRELKVVNLGAQVSVPQLVERAREEKADAVLVSQVVTQRDAHLLNTREMSAAFRESYPADKRPLLVVGGPRFDETMAAELGVDRVFTRGTTPGEVASFIVHRLVNRKASDGTTRSTTAHVGARVVHRRYVPYSHAHYAGNLVDGAYSLGLFGDVATEMCIRHRRRRGPVRVVLRRPVQAARPGRRRPGDRLRLVTRRHPQSRTMDFTVHVVGPRRATEADPGAAKMLDPPLLATSATGVVVVPPRRQARVPDWSEPGSACRRTTRRRGEIFGELPATVDHI